MRFAGVFIAAVLVAGCGGEAGPVGPQGPEGPEGPQGPQGPGPSISSVRPLSIFMEHDATVVISGSGTSWDAGTTVDFGAGVAVTSMVVASPAAIVASVLADSSTVVGTADVAVTDAVGTTTFSGAFSVLSPLEFVESIGTVLPGSLFTLVARQLDEDAPFVLPATAYIAELGVEGGVSLDPDGALSASFVLDLNASPGPMTLVVRSPDPGSAVASRLGVPVDLPAPIVTPLPLATPTAGQITEVRGTVIYQVDAPAGMLVSVSTSNELPAGAPVSAFLMAPDSTYGAGSGESFFSPMDATWFVAMNDILGLTPSFDVTADTAPVAVTAAVLGSNPGAISVVGEIDIYSIALSAGGTIEVALSDGANDTCAPAGNIDATVHFLAPNGATMRVDGPACPTFQVGPVAVAGTYYVRVDGAGGVGVWDYDLTLTIS